MDATKFVARDMGTIVRALGPDGAFDAFVPAPIPRTVALSPATVLALSRADMALGRLAGAGRLLRNPHLLASPYITREAVSSSRIEGTQASLSEVFEAAAEGDPERGDIREVQNYIRALNRGLALLPDLPVSKRLVAEIHGVLMEGVRGRERTPGEFRTTQNFIGAPDSRPHTAVFVPPPPGEQMEAALADWEHFSHETPAMPILVRCALLHYYFETIHPFLDGNGRLGRLLIVFFLVEQGVLPRPLLYLSAYFEDHRSEYADRLQAVRERGEVQEWLQFFLTGVELQAGDAVERAEQLADLRERYREALVGRRSRAGEVVDLLFENPVATAPQVAARLQMTAQGVMNLFGQLEAEAILRPLRERPGRRKVWLAPEVMEILSR